MTPNALITQTQHTITSNVDTTTRDNTNNESPGEDITMAIAANIITNTKNTGMSTTIPITVDIDNINTDTTMSIGMNNMTLTINLAMNRARSGGSM